MLALYWLAVSVLEVPWQSNRASKTIKTLLRASSVSNRPPTQTVRKYYRSLISDQQVWALLTFKHMVLMHSSHSPKKSILTMITSAKEQSTSLLRKTHVNLAQGSVMPYTRRPLSWLEKSITVSPNRLKKTVKLSKSHKSAKKRTHTLSPNSLGSHPHWLAYPSAYANDHQVVLYFSELFTSSIQDINNSLTLL